MEFVDEHGFLEELLALSSSDALWDSSPFFSSTNFSFIDDQIHTSFDQQIYSSPNISDFQDFVPFIEDKTESVQSDKFTFAAGTNSLPSCEKKNYKKKTGDVPSKNLMAERRRRKRLNDRLSMLRSVVPKISKMDRTSILADTIDYMKELLERIKNLQEEMDVDSDQATNILGIFKDLNPNDQNFVRNTPKFEVERKDGEETRIEICCATKPGLLMSTISTLEAMGLDIQQCVVSCFNDFGMQASCSENMEKRATVNSEEIKQALFRNAGYGGRCL